VGREILARCSLGDDADCGRLSVRGQTDRFIPFAPDFLGTLDAAYSVTLASASVRQQRTGSNFIQALRANGGACAYVPTSPI